MNFIYGWRPLSEAIKNGYNFKKIYLQKNLANEDFVEQCIAYCKTKKIQFFFLEKIQMDHLVPQKNHQGFVAELKGGVQKITDLDVFLKKQPLKNLILILDQITDVQNMGTLIRTAVFFGCRLLIVENKNTAPLNETVHRISSGSSLLIPFYFCDKLSQAVTTLQENEFTVYSTAIDGSKDDLDNDSSAKNLVQNTSFKNKTALILGSESQGIRPHLLRQVDETITIFNNRYFDSLNVAVANGILLHEVSKQLY